MLGSKVMLYVCMLLVTSGIFSSKNVCCAMVQDRFENGTSWVRHDPYGLRFDKRDDDQSSCKSETVRSYSSSSSYHHETVDYYRYLRNTTKLQQLKHMLLDRRSCTVQNGEVDDLLRCISAEELNSFDDHGQTMAHKLTPLHWNIALIQKFLDAGLRVDIGSRKPDKYVGATLAHNVAGIMLHRKNKNIDAKWHSRGLQVLVLLYKQKPCHFEYRAGGEWCTVFDLLQRAGYLQEFEKECIQQGVGIGSKSRRKYNR